MSTLPTTPEKSPLRSLPSQWPPGTGWKSALSFGIEPGATWSTQR
jgi:hypothetical protein